MYLRRRRRLYKSESTHTKYVNKYGDVVPSCTTILKIINKKELLYWANSLGWKRKKINDELEKASTIGILTHSYIENIIKNEKVDLSKLDFQSKEVEKGVINSLQSFVKWWKNNKHRIKIIDIEKQFTSDYYGGTIDLICELDGELTIIDFKTSKSFYFSMFLQLAGYTKLYEDITKNRIENVAILRLDKTNSNEAEFMEIDDVVLMSKLDWDSRQMIEYYIGIFEQVAGLYDFLYDISKDWGCDI